MILYILGDFRSGGATSFYFQGLALRRALGPPRVWDLRFFCVLKLHGGVFRGPWGGMGSYFGDRLGFVQELYKPVQTGIQTVGRRVQTVQTVREENLPKNFNFF